MKTLATEEQFLEELEQHVRKSLFPHQLTILEKGLALQKITFAEFFIKGEQQSIGNNLLILKSDSLPEQVKNLGLDLEEVDKFTDDEKIIIEEFGKLITFRIVKIVTDFIAENLGTEAAIEYASNKLENLQVLYEAFEEEVDDNQIEKFIIKTKRQIEELKELNRREKSKIKRIVWNECYDLNRFSIELKEKEIINNHLDFVNIFTNQNICILRKEKKDFLVVLMYELIKKKPFVILTEKNSNRGVLSLIDNFFRDETTPITKTISFTKRHNRICENRVKYDKIKEKVDLFVENHLSKV